MREESDLGICTDNSIFERWISLDELTKCKKITPNSKIKWTAHFLRLYCADKNTAGPVSYQQPSLDGFLHNVPVACICRCELVNFDHPLLSYLSLSIISFPFLFISTHIIFFFRSIIHYSFSERFTLYSSLWFHLFSKSLCHSKQRTGWWALPIKCYIFIIYFYSSLEISCWHLQCPNMKHACSHLFSSRFWHSHCHICHQEAVQLSRL